MAKSQIRYLKSQFLIILLVFLIKRCDADLDTMKLIHRLDFEQMKKNIFTQNIENNFDNKSVTRNDLLCLKELNAIGSGLNNSDLWAMKIVDAWGKIPSGILDGNVYDFGAFSECSHVQRNSTFYKTKYCLGQLDIDSNGVDIDGISSSQPSTGVHIQFGICVPAVCSLDFSQQLIKIDYPINETISIRLNEDTCQLEESVSELKIIDWITIGLLTIVAVLVVMGTAYDLLYTAHDHEKSRVLLAFSFYSNGMKLFSCNQSKSSDVFDCFHGIRVISTAWIVLYHTYCGMTERPIGNKSFLNEFYSQYHNMIIPPGSIAVETFFALSGLLVSISLLKQLERNGRINIPMFYLHRYLRLTPVLGILFLISMTLLRFTGDGPIWPIIVNTYDKRCSKYWWSTLLYVQNYINPDDMCFEHIWYLSVDMQLFIISPMIVYLIYRFKAKALLILGSLILICMGFTLDLHLKYEINKHDGVPLQWWREFYVPTHIRFPSWLIGVIAGYFTYYTRGKTVRISKTFNLLALAISLAVMTVVVFAIYPFLQEEYKTTPLEYGLYITLSRVGWTIAFCYMIFACIHYSGGIINTFLSHPLWQPLSKLSYPIYLINEPLIDMVMLRMKTPPYYSELTFYHMFIGYYVLAVFCAIIATLAIESPIVILVQKRKPKPLV